MCGLVLSLTLLLTSCRTQTSPHNVAVNREAAAEVAKAALAAGKFEYDPARVVLTVSEGEWKGQDVWVVGYVPRLKLLGPREDGAALLRAPVSTGGGPFVYISKTTGEVVQTIIMQ